MQVCVTWNFLRADGKKIVNKQNTFHKTNSLLKLSRYFPAVFFTKLFNDFEFLTSDEKFLLFDENLLFFLIKWQQFAITRLPSNTFLRHLWNCRANRSCLIGSCDDSIDWILFDNHVMSDFWLFLAHMFCTTSLRSCRLFTIFIAEFRWANERSEMSVKRFNTHFHRQLSKHSSHWVQGWSLIKFIRWTTNRPTLKQKTKTFTVQSKLFPNRKAG